jgi:hypothetical protein
VLGNETIAAISRPSSGRTPKKTDTIYDMAHSLRLIGCLLLFTACASSAPYPRQPASLPGCEQAGLSAWLKLNEEAFCPKKPAAQPADHAALAQWMAEMAEKFGPVDENGLLPEDSECDGAICGLYSGYQTRHARARKSGGDFAHLSLADVATIVNYAEWGYQGYNSALWSGKADPKTAGEIRLLNDALLRLPARPGTTYRVEIDVRRDVERAEINGRIRNLLPPGASLDKPVPGHRYLFKGFMSTALTKFPGHEEHAISIEVESKSGRYIAPLSTREFEEEVLLPAGTWFEVVAIRKVPRKKTKAYPLDHQWQVKLREL